jgi:hypothetical protein
MNWILLAQVETEKVMLYENPQFIAFIAGFGACFAFMLLWYLTITREFWLELNYKQENTISDLKQDYEYTSKLAADRKDRIDQLLDRVNNVTDADKAKRLLTAMFDLDNTEVYSAFTTRIPLRATFIRRLNDNDEIPEEGFTDLILASEDDCLSMVGIINNLLEGRASHRLALVLKDTDDQSDRVPEFISLTYLDHT